MFKQHAGWLTAGALVCFLFAGAAFSGPTNPAAVNGGVYNATPPTLSDQQSGVFQLDANGNLKVVSSGTPSGTQDTNIKQTGGNNLVADDAAAGTTAPVPVGGIYNTTMPTYTNLDRTQAQFGSRGSLHVEIWGNDSATSIASATAGDAASNAGSALYTIARGALFNGTTWDRFYSAANSLNSTGTGLATAQQIGQCDDTSPTALTENSFGNARINCADHSQMIGGTIADDAAAGTTYPVPVGGIYNTTLPTYTAGDRTQLQTGNFGVLRVLPCSDASSPVCANAFAALGSTDGAVASSNSQLTATYQRQFNGATWDREFSCPNFAAISVTAGNTTQIVALSGSTVIRVCTVHVATSAAGTWTMVSGTGSNCATPANSTGAMPIATTTTISGQGAVYRGSAGGEFCVAAATGNITGYVMYAQY